MGLSDRNLFSLIDTVRCLSCGHVYTKPNGGGTARANPGCPRCAYVGWLSAAMPLREDPSWRHFGEGLQPSPSAPSG